MCLANGVFPADLAIKSLHVFSSVLCVPHVRSSSTSFMWST